MKNPNGAKTKSLTAIFWRSVLGGWMLALMVSMPLEAQPVMAESKADVPDNFAPPPAPAQPLPFSHKTHLALGVDCRMCHTNPDPGAQMTFPTTQTCMSCHNTVATDKPAIVHLREYSESGQTIPWVRVYRVTPGVNWSHRLHLDAGAQCVSCHGDVGQFDDMAKRKATDAMASCIGCHQSHKVSSQCVTCHAWPSDQVLGVE